MKKKITLSIDSDVYDELDKFPRKPSISEIVTFILKGMLQDIKAGRELTAKELQDYYRQTPEGTEFLERFQEVYGPKFERMSEEIEKIKKKIGMSSKKPKKK